MVTVGFIVHQERKEAAGLAAEIANWLAQLGHEVRLPEADLIGCPELGRWVVHDEALATGLDVCLSIGGDGTMLRTVHAVLQAGVPVLGINVGRLGYLTEVESANWRPALERFLGGDYRVDERTTMDVELHREGAPDDRPLVQHHGALNDAVVEKLGAGHTVRVGVTIDDNAFLSFATDGLIVATATGSTAYNLSAGGPIMSPVLAALVVTPVAPHLLFDRSMVLDPREVVRLEVLDGTAVLAIDGRDHGRIEVGDAVVCRVGPDAARLVTFGERDFRQILKNKFGLGETGAGPDLESWTG
jgi:NAD+ kinase